MRKKVILQVDLAPAWEVYEDHSQLEIVLDMLRYSGVLENGAAHVVLLEVETVRSRDVIERWKSFGFQAGEVRYP